MAMDMACHVMGMHAPHHDIAMCPKPAVYLAVCEPLKLCWAHETMSHHMDRLQCDWGSFALLMSHAWCVGTMTLHLAGLPVCVLHDAVSCHSSLLCL